MIPYPLPDGLREFLFSPQPMVIETVCEQQEEIHHADGTVEYRSIGPSTTCIRYMDEDD